nr:MAG TPA: hypothetical protein [Inoviridae sp.]
MPALRSANPGQHQNEFWHCPRFQIKYYSKATS